MTDDNIFKLYKRVQHKDKNAINELVELHKKAYPDHAVHKQGHNFINRKRELHMMYLHLTRKIK